MKPIKIVSAVAFIGLWSIAFVMYFAWADRDTPLPDEAAAIKAGCEALQNRYRNGDYSKCDGLDANLEGNVWTVGTTLPEGYSGGGVSVELSKIDGRVLYYPLPTQ